MTDQVSIEPLAGHDRTEFFCGVAALDRYFREQVTQDIRRRVTNCFVAIAADGGLIAGYYTLAASSLALTDLPPADMKRLPRYPVLPAVLIGRLAVDHRFRGRGIAGALLSDATQRAMRAEPGVFALIVDAKDDNAFGFYRHHGFTPLQSKPHALFLSIASASKVFVKPDR